MGYSGKWTRNRGNKFFHVEHGGLCWHKMGLCLRFEDEDPSPVGRVVLLNHIARKTSRCNANPQGPHGPICPCWCDSSHTYPASHHKLWSWCGFAELGCFAGLSHPRCHCIFSKLQDNFEPLAKQIIGADFSPLFTFPVCLLCPSLVKNCFWRLPWGSPKLIKVQHQLERHTVDLALSTVCLAHFIHLCAVIGKISTFRVGLHEAPLPPALNVLDPHRLWGHTTLLAPNRQALWSHQMFNHMYQEKCLSFNTSKLSNTGSSIWKTKYNRSNNFFYLTKPTYNRFKEYITILLFEFLALSNQLSVHRPIYQPLSKNTLFICMWLPLAVQSDNLWQWLLTGFEVSFFPLCVDVLGCLY